VAARSRGRRRTAAVAALGLLVLSTAAAQDRLPLCESCHGAGGVSATALTPSIAGQPKLFLENQLVLFREELRISAPMQAAVKGLTDKEIVRLAEHYAAQPARAVADGPVDPALVKQGLAFARKAHCASCHLPDYRGRAQIPRLAGQREDYLVESMLAYRDNRRTGGDTIMAAALYGASDADIRALAHYLARQR
jgi:cytochrome c553